MYKRFEVVVSRKKKQQQVGEERSENVFVVKNYNFAE